MKYVVKKIRNKYINCAFGIQDCVTELIILMVLISSQYSICTYRHSQAVQRHWLCFHKHKEIKIKTSACWCR